jgi:type II secretory pathway pseudopilin PulG
MKANSQRVWVLLVVVGLGGWFLLSNREHGQNDINAIQRTSLTLRSLASGSKAYREVYGQWPTSITDLTTNSNPKRIRFIDPQITGHSALTDGWGNPIEYHAFASNAMRGWVRSLGKDGAVGGKGMNQDIVVCFPAGRMDQRGTRGRSFE